MRTDLWSKQEEELLRQHWGKSKQQDIKLLFPNRHITAIQKKAQRMKLVGDMGLASRKYTFNRQFFDVLTRENCYWSGFIAADGYINNRDKSVVIGLARKDRCILEEFKRITNYDGIILDEIYDDLPSSRMAFYGAKEWISVLYKTFNIHQAKSLTLKPPSSLRDIELIYSFIIGYFDGDGTAYWSNDGVFNFGFVGTYRMLSWIKGYIDILYPESVRGPVNINLCNNYPCLRYAGERALNIHEILKNFQLPFRLQRKWFLND